MLRWSLLLPACCSLYGQCRSCMHVGQHTTHSFAFPLSLSPLPLPLLPTPLQAAALCGWTCLTTH